MVPGDNGLGVDATTLDPILTFSRMSEWQPDKWKYTSTDNRDRGYVPEYAMNASSFGSAPQALPVEYTEGDGTANQSLAAGTSQSWTSEVENELDVPGSPISTGRYSPTGKKPASSVLQVEPDTGFGEFSDTEIYGVYEGDNSDKSYTGRNWEPCGRYEINTKNLLLNWAIEDGGTSDYIAGGLASVGVATSIVYGNSNYSMVVVNSGAGTGSARQATLTDTEDHTVSGYAYQGTANGVPRVLSGTTLLWTGSAGVGVWEYFEVDFTADTTAIYFQNQSTASASPVYFDQLRVTKANDTTGWSPSAANRSCSAFLMRNVITENSNCASHKTKSSWSIPV
jgi:hypothetical protein